MFRALTLITTIIACTLLASCRSVEKHLDKTDIVTQLSKLNAHHATHLFTTETIDYVPLMVDTITPISHLPYRIIRKKATVGHDSVVATTTDTTTTKTSKTFTKHPLRFSLKQDVLDLLAAIAIMAVLCYLLVHLPRK